MPVLVVGADTQVGQLVIDALSTREGEIRAFISSTDAALVLKQRGIKVATGDVSDGSHVGGAALGCFTVVFVGEAARDDRERSFASDAAEVFESWAEAIEMAHPSRVIWVDESETMPDLAIQEAAMVETTSRSLEEVAAEVARLDDQAAL